MKLKTNWHFTKRDGLDILFLFSIFDDLKFSEAQQIFFYKFLLKWGKNEEDFESSIFFEAQKYYFVFESRLNFFFKRSYSQSCFRPCPTLWKSTLKMTTLFRRCLTFFNSTLKYATLFKHCWTLQITKLRYTTLFQRWFDVVRRRDSYQPKNNVEPALECLLRLMKPKATKARFRLAWYL